MALSTAKAVAYTPAAQAALLKAVNRVFDLDRTIESLDELTNGIVLAHILHELDTEFDPSQLDTNPGTSIYLTNKRNLQTVYKGLFRFIRRQIPDLGCQAKRYDYHAVADNPDAQGLCQLLAVMVTAAALGPSNQDYIPRIQNNLDRVTQGEIMSIITNMQADINQSKDDDDLDDAIDAVMAARDLDLFVEEQNASLRQQLEQAKKKLSDYITRLETLQLSHEELKYEKERNDRELEVLKKATQDGVHSAAAIKHLEAQVSDQMDIIARNEEAIRNHGRIRSQLEAEVAKLTKTSKHADEFRDQATEWKHKAEELEKKANIADRYKQKLESQQHLVKEVQNLQYERADLQEQLQYLTDAQERSTRTRQAEDEMTKMITQSEQHLWEEKNLKNQLLRDVALLEDELVRLKAQRTHDESFIQDLQEQIQGGVATGAGVSSGAINLEDELNNASDDGQANLPLEFSRLKAENDLLRRTMGSTGDAALLRRDLEEQKRQRERLQQNFNEIFEKHAVAQEQIDVLINNLTGEGSQPFINMRNENVLLQALHEKDQKREKELEMQLADRERDLLEAKTDLSAIEKDSVDALTELKSTDMLISGSLKAELDRLRDEHSFVVGERDAQKSQLIEALLAKDKLRKSAEADKELQDAVSNDPDVAEAVKKSAEKIEKLRARLKERQQQLEKSEQDKLDLQRKLKATHGGEAASAEKVATDQIIKNLQRENALIATAWYDLTGRLQSNHVVLQRRHDAPKSWLNKQRQMVNATPRR